MPPQCRTAFDASSATTTAAVRDAAPRNGTPCSSSHRVADKRASRAPRGVELSRTVNCAGAVPRGGAPWRTPVVRESML
ncbi:hypothetical protein TPA0909_42540 [Streptomyces albus]|nr:hypothetical protein TPA0909_42540 [Streptomyces albus]